MQVTHLLIVGLSCSLLNSASGLKRFGKRIASTLTGDQLSGKGSSFDSARGSSYNTALASTSRGGNRRRTSGCSLDIIEDLPQNHALLLNPRTGEVLYPDPGSVTLTFNETEEVQLFCTQDQLVQLQDEYSQAQSITAICLNGKLSYNEFPLEKRELACNEMPQAIIRRKPNFPACPSTSSGYEVGIFIDNDHFHVMYEFCYEGALSRTMFTKHEIDRKSTIIQTTPISFTYETNEFNEDPNMTSLFEKETQDAHFSTIFRSSTAYKKISKENWLTQGQLVSYTHHVYRFEQKATFWYLNVKPLWTNVKQHGWRLIESSITDLVMFRQMGVTVYSGVSEQLTHTRRQQHILFYLGFYGANYDLEPVPKFHWKIVHDSYASKAVVLIGVNMAVPTSAVPLCPSVSHELRWLQRSRDPKHQAFYYACHLTTTLLHKLNVPATLAAQFDVPYPYELRLLDE